MSVRETISENFRMSTAVVVVLSLLCVALAVYEITGPHLSYKIPNRAFFTIDDGATLFVDDINKIPPFDHNGAEAVRAMVYSTDSGKHQWTQYLLKCPPSLKQRLEQLHGGIVQEVTIDDGLVKAPGAREWVQPNDISRMSVTTPVRPAGLPDGPISPVTP